MLLFKIMLIISNKKKGITCANPFNVKRSKTQFYASNTCHAVST